MCASRNSRRSSSTATRASSAATRFASAASVICSRLSRLLLPAQRALTTKARMTKATDAGNTSMPVPLLNARAAPEGAVLWLQMIQE